MKQKTHILLLLSELLASVNVYGQSYTPVSLPHLFSDHMVLQKGERTAIWGGGQAGKTIRLNGSWAPKDTIKVRVNGIGKWKASLKATHYGGPYRLYISDGNTQITLNDVMVGEVWLCSGQSNMEWTPDNGLTDKETEISHADCPDIRFFNVNKQTGVYPQDDCQGTWEVCSPSVMKKRSAVAYFFARTLNDSLKVPVGVIVSAWGATEAAVWCPTTHYSYPEDYQEWIQQKNSSWPSTRGIVYNQMIHPILPFTFKGSIWYQGESNRHQPASYGRELQTLITSWRKEARREFPFYLVQIAPYHYRSTNNGPALIREAQEWVTKHTAKTGKVVISDCIDDLSTIHPLSKRPVGVRLAHMALNKDYGQTHIACESPELHAVQLQGNRMIVSLTFTSDGLICKGDTIHGLEIAGADKIFVKAEGKIDKDNRLIVYSPQVKHPFFVRYCFNDDTVGNLFNKAGLPVSPFRTDK